VIAQGIYDAVVFMSIATTLIAPPLLSLTYREIAERKPVPVEDQPSII
jgi:hypothetical protein